MLPATSRQMALVGPVTRYLELPNAEPIMADTIAVYRPYTGLTPAISAYAID